MTQHPDAKIYLVDDDVGVREALAWLLREERLLGTPANIPRQTPSFDLKQKNPARTPRATVDLLNRQVREALDAPDHVAQLATHGLQPMHQSPEDFARRVRADHERWGPIVRATGFTAED